ncbi:thioesterase family protein [Barrientosiimonas marina]|uniref:Acyl-CoA thioesterase n=1 Tax=Lentibacillus kimchii TaxID=1542911 RepID=A0ABW2UVE8_9BACI
MTKVSYIEDLDQWMSEFSFYIPVKVRFSETDMFGHVNNVSAFIYFEEARIEFLKQAGVFPQEHDEKVMPIVADLQCDYHRQIYFNETIKLYVKLGHVGNTSLDVHYMALNDNYELSLTGRGRMVMIHSDTEKPVPMNDTMKRQLMAL